MSRVALIGENSVEYINKLIDIWNSGNCAVLIDWRIPFDTAIEMMNEADVRECYIEDKFLKTSCVESIKFTTYVNLCFKAQLIPTEIYNKFRDNYSNEEAVVIYSSGTTGKAKGVILSHFAINTNADAIIDYMCPKSDDCIYFPKTFSHSSSVTGEILVALKTKMKAVVAPTIVPPRYVFANIEKFGVSIICLNPTLLDMYATEFKKGVYDLTSLKVIYVSGSILTDKIYGKAHSAFENIKIYNVYGLSEAGPRVAAQRIDCCNSNSVGKPIKGVSIKIVDDNGQELGKNEKGIICVKTPSVFSGYLIGCKELKKYDLEYLNTGDIGYIDDFDELHIVDRCDDVIIIDSHKIYPNEIEKQVLHFFDFEDCLVKQVIIGDSQQLCCYYIDRINNHDELQIHQKLKKVLPSYELPRRFIKCDSFPKTYTGKKIRGEKMDGFLELEKETFECISNFIKNTYDIEYEKEMDLITDVGIDSIGFISLVIELESHYNITFIDEDILIENFRSLKTITDLIVNIKTRTNA